MGTDDSLQAVLVSRLQAVKTALYGMLVRRTTPQSPKEALMSRWREKMKTLFTSGLVKTMADDFCNDGFAITDWSLDDSTPDEERWFEIGVCRHGEKVTWLEWKDGGGPEWGSPWDLVGRPQSEWPKCVEPAMWRLGEWILNQVQNGSGGC